MALKKGKLKSEKSGRNRVLRIVDLEAYFIEAKENQKSALYFAMCKRIGR
jgi:hypothetical protein